VLDQLHQTHTELAGGKGEALGMPAAEKIQAPLAARLRSGSEERVERLNMLPALEGPPAKRKSGGRTRDFLRSGRCSAPPSSRTKGATSRTSRRVRTLPGRNAGPLSWRA
jgi:hypothetical protein